MKLSMLTAGSFETEAAAWQHFDQQAQRSEAFRSYEEVDGEYIITLPGVVRKTPRIDRVLVPSQSLVSAGWPHGPIGVEGKRSGMKIGKVLSQTLDYTQAVFEIAPGFHLMLEWFFIWPLEGATGDLGSVMAQNRIGWVRSSQRTPLVFGCGGTHGITIHTSGLLEAKTMPMGRKRGSR